MVPAGRAFGLLGEPYETPVPGLKRLAQGAYHIPFVLGGHAPDVVEVVADNAGLRQVKFLGRPFVGLGSRHRLSDGSFFPKPDFVTDDVTRRDTLEVFLCRGRVVIDNRPVRKVDDVALRVVARGDVPTHLVDHVEHRPQVTDREVRRVDLVVHVDDHVPAVVRHQIGSR